MDFQNTFLGGKDFSTSTGNNYPSLTIKFSPGNCLTCSCNGTVVVSLFPLRLPFPLVDSKDRSRAIVEGTGLCSPSELPSMSKFQEDGVADDILFDHCSLWFEQAKGL